MPCHSLKKDDILDLIWMILRGCPFLYPSPSSSPWPRSTSSFQRSFYHFLLEKYYFNGWSVCWWTLEFGPFLEGAAIEANFGLVDTFEVLFWLMFCQRKCDLTKKKELLDKKAFKNCVVVVAMFKNRIHKYSTIPNKKLVAKVMRRDVSPVNYISPVSSGFSKLCGYVHWVVLNQTHSIFKTIEDIDFRFLILTCHTWTIEQADWIHGSW